MNPSVNPSVNSTTKKILIGTTCIIIVALVVYYIKINCDKSPHKSCNCVKDCPCPSCNNAAAESLVFNSITGFVNNIDVQAFYGWWVGTVQASILDPVTVILKNYLNINYPDPAHIQTLGPYLNNIFVSLDRLSSTSPSPATMKILSNNQVYNNIYQSFMAKIQFLLNNNAELPGELTAYLTTIH